jgi:hypothetical protein
MLRKEVAMKRNNTVKLPALVCLMCFSLNAATINVAKGSSISTAVQTSVAHDTIKVAADTFIDNFVINHPLTIIGASETTTIIKRADHDSSLATIRITAKNVTIKNLTVCGHNAVQAADTLDTLTCWPASDAVLLSGAAESTSIASCIFIGGDGIMERSLPAAQGGSGLVIKKSDWVFLKNDSIQGGCGRVSFAYGDTSIDEGGARQPFTMSGVPGAGILADTSRHIVADSTVVKGGAGYDMNWRGHYTPGTAGLVCHRADSVIVSHSIIYGGVTQYFGGDTVEAIMIYNGSWVDTVNCQLSSDGGWADETSVIGPLSPAGVPFYHHHIIDKNNAFSLRRGNDQSLLLACLLTKESFVAIDLLNAKGQAVKKLRPEHASPGLHRYTLDLKMINGSKTVYFLKVATKDNRRCFKVVSVQ